ncbi:MAG TPA: hypothetical protein VLD63_09545 [Anaerolineales bacterium]|nr:hypothetical protein [Anaerolineales bacterium]
MTVLVSGMGHGIDMSGCLRVRMVAVLAGSRAARRDTIVAGLIMGRIVIPGTR